MKRELKFRAWAHDYDYSSGEPVYKEMLKVISIDFENDTVCTEYKIDKVSEWKLSDTNIMQFTGLKDKNGVDIYEGDILRNPIECDWDKVNFSCFEVFFHDGDAHADYNIGYTMCRMHNHGSVCGGYIPAFKPKITSKMVVIGNIYETPEIILPPHNLTNQI